MDNAAERRTVELCYRTHKTLVNPIIDWTDEDVWQFIRENNLSYCKLYDEGLDRLGCIGCPLGNFRSMQREFERWPQFRKMYVAAFDEMNKVRSECGKNNKFETGEDIMKWWTGQARTYDPNQISMFEEE